MSKIALVGSKLVCVSGSVGVVVTGQADCSINGFPVAVIGDSVACSGKDIIITGHPALTINGKPVAIVGSITKHGGIIIEGSDALNVK